MNLVEVIQWKEFQKSENKPHFKPEIFSIVLRPHSPPLPGLLIACLWPEYADYYETVFDI